MKDAAIKPFVLDASVALVWAFEDEQSSYAEAVLDALGKDAEAVTPAIWPLEISNALLMALRKQRLTQAQAMAFFSRIRSLKIVVDEASLIRTFEAIFLQGHHSLLTSYDASYLELALRMGLPLATLDEDLKKAAAAAGVAMMVFEPSKT